jgi:hypothetical protein
MLPLPRVSKLRKIAIVLNSPPKEGKHAVFLIKKWLWLLRIALFK